MFVCVSVSACVCVYVCMGSGCECRESQVFLPSCLPSFCPPLCKHLAFVLKLKSDHSTHLLKSSSAARVKSKVLRMGYKVLFELALPSLEQHGVLTRVDSGAGLEGNTPSLLLPCSSMSLTSVPRVFFTSVK